MISKHDPTNLPGAVNALAPKIKAPSSARVLNSWITKAQDDLGTAGARLGWLVAATVVSAALQRAVDEQGAPLFLLKGGTMLQYRLPGMSRATKDIDGLVRGDVDRFLLYLDSALMEPWGPLTFVRGRVEMISTPNRIVTPRRFDISVLLKGVTWRRVQVEISAEEGLAGASSESIVAPSLAGFGLEGPERLVCLSMAYQIAQKIHACTDPHEPPAYINDRARDVVDLLLLRAVIDATQQPTLAEIRAAVEDIFDVRAVEARDLGTPSRAWPVRSVVHPHWGKSFSNAAYSAGLSLSLEDAIGQLNDWLSLIEYAGSEA